MKTHAQPAGNDVESNGTLQRLAGTYLTFKLCGEEFAVAIVKVQEIVRTQKVTHVPCSPDYMRGLTNLRGKVIPVVDLRAKFALPAIEDTEKTCIVIAEIELGDHAVTIGMVVDEVLEVVEIRADHINETPELGSVVDVSFIIGVARINSEIVMLLDIDKIMTVPQIVAVSEAPEHALEKAYEVPATGGDESIVPDAEPEEMATPGE